MICDWFPWPFCFLICMGIPGWELRRERFSSLPFQQSNRLASTRSFWLESTWVSQYGGFQSWSSVSFFISFLSTGPTFSRIQGGTFDFVHSFLFPEVVHFSLLDPYVESTLYVSKVPYCIWIGNIFQTITTDNSLVFDPFQLELLLPNIALLFSIYALYL